jgi:putative glycosyltransferase (TIGR04372 family)
MGGFRRHLADIKQGGSAVLFRKARRVFLIAAMLPGYIPAIPLVLLVRAIRPWLLVRVGSLMSSRIGHFAANTELYLCEKDAGINRPEKKHIDIFYLGHQPIANRQLLVMWRRVLRIWPAWLLAPADRLNRLIPNCSQHVIGNNTQHDRDVHNLQDGSPPHLKFTQDEELRGEAGLRAMGIPSGAPFVCLTVRDSAYLASHFGGGDFNYHNYRDADINNFVLASEYLADRGYFVIRMGAKVSAPMGCSHPKIIDYATNGMRSDFMDIYLGAKCIFAISTATGWDAVPVIFRRPICYVGILPVGYFMTFSSSTLLITKHHRHKESRKKLSLQDIFNFGLGYCMKTSDYENQNVELIDNTPAEILDVVVEMVERLTLAWQGRADDEILQQRFLEIYPSDSVDAVAGKPLHGEIRARVGSTYLQNNQDWLR